MVLYMYTMMLLGLFLLQVVHFLCSRVLHVMLYFPTLPGPDSPAFHVSPMYRGSDWATVPEHWG